MLPERFAYRRNSCSISLGQPVRNEVGIYDSNAKNCKHVRDSAFAATDVGGESNQISSQRQKLQITLRQRLSPE